MRLPQAVIFVLTACGASKPAAPAPPVGNTSETPPVESPPPPAAPACDAISGTMMDAVRNEPMVGATVLIQGGQLISEQVVLTDEGGVWKIVGPQGATRMTVYYDDKTAELILDPTKCDLGVLTLRMKSP